MADVFLYLEEREFKTSPLKVPLEGGRLKSLPAVNSLVPKIV